MRESERRGEEKGEREKGDKRGRGRGRGRRDNLTKLKGSAISEKQQERRQADVEEIGTSSWLVLTAC